jgi:hypothetical protein
MNLSDSGIQEISRLDEELLSSQQERCLMEVVEFLSMFYDGESLFQRYS